jgi:endonuclease-3
VDNLAASDHKALAKVISFVHYNKQKAKHLVACAELLRRTFRGVVPTGARALQQLPGIGPIMAELLVVLLAR